jgi:branched-chain amino acid transport system permease protein
LFNDVIRVTQGGAYEVTLSVKQILIIAITALLLACFWYIIQKTPFGRAQRACEQDRHMAALLAARRT